MTGTIVFGKSGQVARELARRMPHARFVGREEADLDDPGTAAAAIAQARPGLVINAAAWTDVDGAEANERAATRVNAEAPAEMARACARGGIPFLHISTDYVFDGSGSAPWGEDAPTAPLGAYGRSKRLGEVLVAESAGPHVILRTSWVFSAHGRNFVTTMLRLGAARDTLRIVDDQIGGPTPAADIARALDTIATAFAAGKGHTGLYHFAGRPEASWAGFAREIFAQAGMGVAVEPIPSRDYPTPATRPGNSRLDCARIARDYGIAAPDWRQGLAQVLRELEDGNAA